MIKFLFKGVIRDKSKSLLPVIVVTIGVAVTVILYCWINGIMGQAIEMNANFNSGHVRVMTRAYAKEAHVMPNDLAILEVSKIHQTLKDSFPDMDWVKRIRFGGLVDLPDSVGETRAQGPVIGWAIDLLSPNSKEIDRFNIRQSIVTGKLPQHPFEALLSHDLAQKFNVKIGDAFTLFGTTMNGTMAFRNFTLAGTVRFGTTAVDRGAIITDITDGQTALQMNDGASEILGFFNNAHYNNEKALQITTAFNANYQASTDEFAPIMFTFKQQESMADLVDMANAVASFMIFIFVMAMSVVLWNAGLLGTLRRFNEFGVRLALGESKNHLYITLLYEAVLIGSIGTLFGTTIGLSVAYLLQTKGIDIGFMMQGASLMMPTVARASITPTAFYIGFIPGLLSMLLGNALAGLQIYKRQTAQLFKELEV